MRGKIKKLYFKIQYRPQSKFVTQSEKKYKSKSFPRWRFFCLDAPAKIWFVSFSFFHFDEQRAGELKALISDEDGNLVILGLKKDRAEKIADFRLGTKVNSIKSKSGQEIVIFVSCNDGSIRMLNAVNVDNQEVNYLDFQNYFCSEIPFIGGFNLRGSRQLSQQYRSARFVSKGNVLDGDILEQYFSMTKTLQQYISDESEM